MACGSEGLVGLGRLGDEVPAFARRLRTNCHCPCHRRVVSAACTPAQAAHALRPQKALARRSRPARTPGLERSIARRAQLGEPPEPEPPASLPSRVLPLHQRPIAEPPEPAHGEMSQRERQGKVGRMACGSEGWGWLDRLRDGVPAFETRLHTYCHRPHHRGVVSPASGKSTRMGRTTCQGTISRRVAAQTG